MGTKGKSASDTHPRMNALKWIFKALLTQVGCLSSQELAELPPSDGAPYSHHLNDNAKSTNSSRRHSFPSRKKSKDHGDQIRWCDCQAAGLSGHTCGGCCDKKEKDKAGGTMFSLQNCTLQSNDQGNGESYWVSFEEKSFSKGEDFKVYNGKMNGLGPKSGEKCVVKVFRHRKGTESLCCCEVKKSLKAREYARAFNDQMRNKKLRIKFATVYWAQMDEVSKLKQLFFTGERRLSAREAVLFEDDIRVNDERPNKPRKPSMYMDCWGKNKHCVAKDLEAFAHFTYHQSHGQLVICGLDGVQDDGGFFLKTPTIHSNKAEYGPKDQGKEGIWEVFRNHVCNDFCKNFIKPDDGASDCENENVAIVSNEKCGCGPPPLAHPNLQSSESRIPQVPPPLQSQESTVSEKSQHSDMQLRRQESTMSQVTESLSGYLEPTAPMAEETNETVFLPTPPPYSQMNVATWLLEQQARNSFIPPVCEIIPRQPTAPVASQMSVESGPSVSSASQNHQRLDLNANISTTDDIDFSRMSTTGCVDDCESLRAASVANDRKQVRFTIDNGTSSTVTTSTAVNSDSAMELSTVTGGSSSPTTQLRSILRQQSAASSSGYSSQITPIPFFHPASHPSVIQRSITMQDTCLSGYGVGNHMTQPIPDHPPSYTDSQLSTACWIIRGDYPPPPQMFLGQPRLTDNGHPSQVMNNNGP